MPRARWIVFVGLAGCANFDSVDDACRDGVRGERHGSDAAADVVGRISCYRRFVGLDRGDIDKRITAAVESHADYLGTNQVLSTTGDWWAESPGLPGFTGVGSFDRLEAAEYLVASVGSAFVWEVLLPAAGGGTGVIDEVLIDPFARDALLAPAWEGGGYAEFGDPVLGGDFAYMNIVLYYPSGSRATRPVVYPQDGQTDLPTSWNVDPTDAAFAGLPEVAGFPISFTMGSSRVVTGDNPLEVAVLNSTITGPSGEVPHVVLLPGLYTVGVNWSTAILAPLAPLEPNTDYTVEADLAWVDVPKKHEELVFTTGSVPAP